LGTRGVFPQASGREQKRKRSLVNRLEVAPKAARMKLKPNYLGPLNPTSLRKRCTLKHRQAVLETGKFCRIGIAFGYFAQTT
jgi:hypothetical protein